MQSRSKAGKGMRPQRGDLDQREAGEARSPCAADKAPSLCWAEHLEHEMFLFLVHCQPAGLGGMWSSLFPFIGTPLLHTFVTVSDFAFVILTQSHQIRQVNYCFFWDTSPGSPTSWFHLWQQEEHVFGGKKAQFSSLCWCLSVLAGLNWQVLLRSISITDSRDEAAQKTSQREIFKIHQRKWMCSYGAESMEWPQVAPGKVQVGYYEKFLHWKIEWAL